MSDEPPPVNFPRKDAFLPRCPRITLGSAEGILHSEACRKGDSIKEADPTREVRRNNFAI